VTNNTGSSPPERQESRQEPSEAPVSDTGASAPTDVSIDESSLGELAKETIKTQDRQLSREEWTRRALIIGVFVLFLVMFVVPAYAALLSDQPFNNVLKVVAYFAPFVTALGGYIAGHYFPSRNPPQNPGGGGPVSS
jgi:hypothetical protein